MSLPRTFPLLYKIFFIGLLLQFVLQTFVTYQLGLEGGVWSMIWLRKEIIVVVLGGWMVVDLTVHRQRKQLLNSQRVVLFLSLFVATLVVSLLAHFVGVGGGVSEFVAAFKYDFFGFVILLVGLGASWRLTPEDKQHLIDWSIEVFKWTLLLSIVWYLIVAVKPGVLKLLGFNPFSYEGVVGSAPPAMYYTHINQGLPRNSFVFERPTTRGFFLVALRPLLYLRQLRHRPLRTSRLWWVIMGTNILITFSRAAWGSWLIVTLLCVARVTTDLRKVLIKFAIPLIIGFVGVGYLGYQQIFARTYSNTGHIAMLVQAGEMIQASPRVGRGGASAGPGSHQFDVGFNPENQFLQLRVEFGVGGFVLWGLLFGSIIRLGWRYRDREELVAISLGMLGLAISGMVLHSFADRMVVYPWMILVGVVISSHIPTMKPLSLDTSVSSGTSAPS